MSFPKQTLTEVANKYSHILLFELFPSFEFSKNILIATKKVDIENDSRTLKPQL